MAFINTLPVDWGLLRSKRRAFVQIVRGAPTTLNRLMAEKRLDISPVSSIAAAEHAEDWLVFDRLCIGCKGEVGSVILQSDCPAKELDGRSVSVTPQSATAVGLLEILLSRHWNAHARLITGHDLTNAPADVQPRECIEISDGDSAERRPQGKRSPGDPSLQLPSPRLLIGDAALRVAQSNPGGFIYDLGRVWREHTGLGFVFGLWCVRKSFAEQHPAETQGMFHLLADSYARGRTHQERVAAEAARATGLSQFVIEKYFDKLVYELDDELWHGLNHFLGLLGGCPGRLQRFSETKIWTERLGA
jgi:chorismate dehydratase